MVRSLQIESVEEEEERLGQLEPFLLESIEEEEERMGQLEPNAFLWVTSCKPSLAFRLLDSLKKDSGSSLTDMTEEQAQKIDMTEEQAQKIEALETYIKAEEEKVERELKKQERIQNLIGDSTAVSRVESLVEMAIGGLVDGMEGVMKMGDCVRLKTLKGLLEVLNPTQGVEFLTATCTNQINMRGWANNQ